MLRYLIIASFFVFLQKSIQGADESKTQAALDQKKDLTLSNESELGILTSGGNSKIKTYKGKTESTIQWGLNDLVTFNGDYTDAQSNNIKSANDWLLKGKYQRGVNLNLGLFISYQMLSNPFSGIKRRYDTDLGGNIKLIHSDLWEWILEPGLRYTVEKKSYSRDSLGQIFEKRGRLYTKLIYRPNQQLEAKLWAEYIPSFDHSSSYLMSFSPSLTIMISHFLSLKTSFLLNYNNNPPILNSKTDSQTSTSFVANF